jgi:AraC family transcriptional regulator
MYPVICGKQGVTVTHQQHWVGFGIEEVAYEIRWAREPGWLMLEVRAPSLCIVATEVGGRCELRPRADQPVEGEYFGSDALSLAAPGRRVVTHAVEMRHARLCCFALHAGEANYLSPEDVAAVGLLKSRYMFRDERIRTCATLLDRDRVLARASTTYTRSLSKALFAAVLDMGAREQPPAAALTGASWSAVSSYIRDHLAEPITMETLAEIAKMPPGRFGPAFHEATGMSLRRWQMDLRVRMAQRLLTDNPNDSLAKVATVCGFADQSHFSRAFLSVVGLTPTAWLHIRT